jgi:2-polyprenyl-3-methyl-5-hydroxy-6-metoxy-1,4-benzoquinol methylase
VGRLIDVLKRVPLDLGQGAVAETTQGKKIALSLVPPGVGRTALDIGARAGHQTRWLVGKGYEVTSIDLDPQFEGCQRVDVNAPLPFPDGAFDLIWCSEVVEHLEDPVLAAREFRRVVRPGGDVIVTTPNSYAWLFRLIALFGLTPQRIQRADHRHFFDIRAMRALFPDADLYGYFPYALIKLTITRGVGALSPTFVVHVRA